MSIEEASRVVPAEHRARFLDRAQLVYERARASGSSELELALALRVLSVLCGAAATVAHGRDS